VLRELLQAGTPLSYTQWEAYLAVYYRKVLLIATPQARGIQRLLTVDPAYIAELKPEMQKATQTHFYVPLHELLKAAHDRNELEIVDIDLTTKILIKLIFAESLMSGDEEDQSIAASNRESYARHVTDLVTRGLLPRPTGAGSTD